MKISLLAFVVKSRSAPNQIESIPARLANFGGPPRFTKNTRGALKINCHPTRMFDETDTRLEAWTKSALEGVEVSLSSPSDTADGADKNRISLYLMDVIPVPAQRGTRLPPVQAILRYLITAQAKDLKEAHRLLGELMVAAADMSDFELEIEALPADLWQSFGLHPRPAFVLRVPFKFERKEKPVKRVRTALQMQQTPLVPFQGKVISTSNIPLAGAKVELPFFKLYTETDADGFFRFPAVPAEPKDKSLFIRAKGREFSISTKQAESKGGQLVIQLPMEE